MKRFYFAAIILLSFLWPNISSATTLSLSPTGGGFSVGSTFSVSVILNTEGKSINALSVFLSFPPDKLQVVSPSVGQSIVDVWTVPPKFNNNTGTIEFEGGIPGGIIASKGTLTNITFRVKSVGEAIIKFSDRSRVFLDDGLATDDLSQTGNGVYQFKLPPPGGPIVISESHQDQSVWYANPNPTLSFANESAGVEGFSYILNSEPISVPDNISEGSRQSISYTGIVDGIHYFHVKALRGGAWGGTTHFAVKIDTTPPADFPLTVLPGKRTVSLKPVLEFDTTDSSSGLDHYELRIEPLSADVIENRKEETSFFVEASSPFVTPELSLGSYNAIVRAYDHAGNYREVTEKITITTTIFSFIADRGIQIRNMLLIPWSYVWSFGIIILLILLFIAHRTFHWHKGIHLKHTEKILPQDVASQLAELQKYREKYGKALVFLLILLSALSYNSVDAQTKQSIPPLVTTYSESISNKEIFYIGGRVGNAEEAVVLYTQNLETGETFSYEVTSNTDGDWFYRHNTFLPPGEYLMWVQGKQGEQWSPPSSQITISVERAAIQFGANRLSYEAVYLFLVIVLLVLITALTIFIIFHYRQGKKKYKKFQTEVQGAQESVRRGFTLLRRDIESELEILRKNLQGELALEEKHKEAELLNDLNAVQKRIGNDIWEIQRESW